MDDRSGAAEAPRPPEPEAAASPHLAPDPAPVQAAPRRRGGAATAAGALAAAAIVIAVVLWGLAPRGAPPAVGGGAARALAPLRPRSDVLTGEQVAPFSGFAVSVDTDPPGALVSIGGVPRGEAPVLAGLECAPGDRVEIAAEKGGYAVARASTTCRADALVKLTLRLRR